MLGAWGGDNDPTPKKFTVTKPPESEVTMEEAKVNTEL
jgi:hypothetical protein